MSRTNEHNSFLSSPLTKAAACLLFAASLSTPAFAAGASTPNVQVQNQKEAVVTGVIKDRSGEGLPGVSILERGTTNGTTTDLNGHFSLKMKNPQNTLVMSYVGYQTQSLIPGAKRKLAIILREDDEVLNDVVVIGYGTQKKADVTSSVASVSSEEFNKGSVLDAGQLIQGKVAGLQISLPTGDPSSTTKVMLRGTSTLMGTTDPLILIDGIPGNFQSVAPEEIESIDVLKDGSATAIYGTRGTNGVIIITTKNAMHDMPAEITYEGYLSISNQAKRPDFMSASDLRQRWADGYSFSGANDQDYGATTNWLDEISKTGISHSHNLTFRGGTNQTSLIANLNYTKRDGTFINSGTDMFRGRIEVNHRMFDDKLTTHLALNASERTYDPTFDNDNTSGANIYRNACIHNPTEPVYNSDGTYMERDVYFYNNPVTMLKETTGEARRRNIRFTGSLEYKPYQDLTLKAMYNRKTTSAINGSYTTHLSYTTTENGVNGSASRSASDYRENLVELTADWHHTFADKHHVGAIIGYNYEDETSENFSAANRNFPTDSYSYNKLEAGQGLIEGTASMSSYKYNQKLIGLFARVTYNFDDRYLLMASLRHEGSSKFGKGRKWGNFPGISAGWRINNEAFMKDVDWISNLKLRVGYGVTGINIADPYQSLYSLNYDDSFLYDGQWIQTLVPVRNANEDLHWEKKHEFNLGIDYDFFGGRLNGSIDYYIRNTKDALWNYSVPTPPYQYGSILANVGQIRNTGLEILIAGTPVKTHDFQWKSSISYSTNTNKLVSISNDQFQMSTDWFTPSEGYTGEPIQSYTHRVKVGDPIGNFFGLKSVGVDENGKWVVERLHLDADGNPTGEVYYDLAENASTDDYQVLGNGVPKHYLNFNNTLNWKGWDLSINMRGAFGYQILNYQQMFYGNPTIQYNVLNSAFDEHNVVAISADGLSYSETGKGAVINDAQRYVSEYVENGSYWKIDNITLGYSFDLKNVKYIQSLRLYASCLNLATITGYKGLDPEVSSTGLAPGIDERDKYPTTRSFTFGIGVTF